MINRINFNSRLDKNNLGLSVDTENPISWEEAVLIIERKLQEIDERILRNLTGKGELY